MIRRASWLLISLLLCTALVKPDGGAVLFTATSQALIFTVFVTPSPVHAGQADLSVLLQRETDRAPVLNATITATLTGTGIRPITAALTHAAASDKLLYAASVELPQAGRYRVDIQTRTAKVSGNLVVLSEEAPLVTYWPYFAVVPAAIGLFFLNRSLKAQRARS